MAFKMKGSPHKMGKIQGTSGHTSALKQKLSIMDKIGSVGDALSNLHPDHSLSDVYENYKVSKKNKRKVKRNEETDKAPTEMKSPLEQNKFAEGVKKVGKFLKSGKVDNLNETADKVKKSVKKKVDSYKPKSETVISTKTRKGGKYKRGSENEHTRDNTEVTATTTTNKKKLFGGNKKTTTSSSVSYPEYNYTDGDSERGVGGDREQGNTTTTHTRNKRGGGGKKKEVTVNQGTGKKTVTRYKKDGSVKSTKVKKGDYSTYSTPSNKRALREENKGK